MIDGLLLAAFIIGIMAGGYMIARSPAFWLGFIMVTFTALKPHLVKLLPYFVKLFKPYDTDTQKKLDDTRRQGREWDYFNKRPRERK